MARLGRLLGSSVASSVLAAGAVIAVGCATSGPADLGPDVDPTIPGLDASSSNKPSMPGQSDSSSGGEDTEDGSVEQLDDAATATDAKPVVDANKPDTYVPPTGGTKPTAGEVLISEVMFDPSGTEPATEWIELHSVAASERTLTGLTLKDGGDRTHVIGTLTIAAGAYVVLARVKADAITSKVPAAAIVYEYGAGLGSSQGIQLANGATGGIKLLNGATEIASAPYGGWFSSTGSSIQLKVLTAAAQAMQASWCSSATAWAAGSDKGTPGAASDCP